MDRIRARYLIETALDPESVAKTLAGEQSSGMFVKVPAETEGLIERFSAHYPKMNKFN